MNRGRGCREAGVVLGVDGEVDSLREFLQDRDDGLAGFALLLHDDDVAVGENGCCVCDGRAGHASERSWWVRSARHRAGLCTWLAHHLGSIHRKFTEVDSRWGRFRRELSRCPRVDALSRARDHEVRRQHVVRVARHRRRGPDPVRPRYRSALLRRHAPVGLGIQRHVPAEPPALGSHPGIAVLRADAAGRVDRLDVRPGPGRWTHGRARSSRTRSSRRCSRSTSSMLPGQHRLLRGVASRRSRVGRADVLSPPDSARRSHGRLPRRVPNRRVVAYLSDHQMPSDGALRSVRWSARVVRMASTC